MSTIPKETWLVDFEFSQPEGERPRPVCMVALNFHTGESRRTWLWGHHPEECPIPLDPGALYVAYLASAEVGCHLALGWPAPRSVLDLYAEFRWITSGRMVTAGRSLLGALSYFGDGFALDPIGKAAGIDGGQVVFNWQQQQLVFMPGSQESSTGGCNYSGTAHESGHGRIRRIL